MACIATLGVTSSLNVIGNIYIKYGDNGKVYIYDVVLARGVIFNNKKQGYVGYYVGLHKNKVVKSIIRNCNTTRNNMLLTIGDGAEKIYFECDNTEFIDRIAEHSSILKDFKLILRSIIMLIISAIMMPSLVIGGVLYYGIYTLHKMRPTEIETV